LRKVGDKSMKNLLILIVYLYTVVSLAQTTTPPAPTPPVCTPTPTNSCNLNPNPTTNVATNNGQFTLSASAMSLSTKVGSVPAIDIGSTFAWTVNNSLRADLITAPSASAGQGYFIGNQYLFPSKWILAKTNFDPTSFQFYATASGGLVRIAGQQHPGFLAGGGINYDPTHTSKFTVNLIEVRAARMPYVANGTVLLISGGLNLGW
jgi:hypothetical protein